MRSTSHLYDGLIFEYRVDDVLRAVLTATVQPDGILVQHLMAWPGSGPRTLPTLLLAAERAAIERYRPSWIVLDVEHTHPRRDQLARLAERLGWRRFNSDEHTTWFVKYYSRRTHDEVLSQEAADPRGGHSPDAAGPGSEREGAGSEG